MSDAASAFHFFIATFGCKVSQYESQALREHWMRLGGRETDEPRLADVILIASCAVTAEAVADARQTARKWGREIPGARIVVTGCAASAEPGDFFLPGVTAVVPQNLKANLLSVHPLELDGEKCRDFAMPCRPEKGRDAQGTAKPERKPDGFPPFRIEGFRRARPVLKVQDGCSHGCSYCIVPLTRGPSCSRPPTEAVDEARRLLEAGHREIMVSGINLRQYHAEGQNFWGLLRRLNRELAPEWQGRARLRLSSLEPAQLDAEGLETLEACSLLCPHLHLSLQSGSPAVLRRMGRQSNPERVIDAMDRIRGFWPVFGLGADILMGFPGESESEVRETLDIVQSLPLTYAHVFPWSSRPGTTAATMPGALPKAERQEHAARVRALIAGKHATFLDAQSTLPDFVFAGDGDGASRGINEYYAPCRLEEGVIMAEGHELLPVRPVDVKDGHLLCRPLRLAKARDLS